MLCAGAVSAIAYYFAYKIYENEAFEIKIPPAKPLTYLQIDNACLSMLQHTMNENHNQKNPNIIQVVGPSGSGKSVSVYHYAEKTVNNKRCFEPIRLPRSKIYAFLDGRSEQKFYYSLEYFASEIADQYRDRKFFDDLRKFPVSFNENKIDFLFDYIFQKLSRHSNWLLIVDNLNSVSGPLLYNCLQKWFINHQNENIKKNTIFVSDDHRNLAKSTFTDTFPISGLSLTAATELFHKISCVEPSSAINNIVKEFVEIFQLVPLSITAAAQIVNHELCQRSTRSVESIMRSTVDEVLDQVGSILVENDMKPTDHNVYIVSSEVLIAKAINNILRDSPEEIEKMLNFLSVSSISFECPEIVLRKFIEKPDEFDEIKPFEKPDPIFPDVSMEITDIWQSISKGQIKPYLLEMSKLWDSLKLLFTNSNKRPNILDQEKISSDFKSNAFLQVHSHHCMDWLSLHPLVYNVTKQLLPTRSWTIYSKNARISSQKFDGNNLFWSFVNWFGSTSSQKDDHSISMKIAERNKSSMCDLSKILLPESENNNQNLFHVGIRKFLNDVLASLSSPEPFRIPYRNYCKLYRLQTLSNLLDILREFPPRSDISSTNDESFYSIQNTEDACFIAKLLRTLANCYPNTSEDFARFLHDAEGILEKCSRNSSISWPAVAIELAKTHVDLSIHYLEKDHSCSVDHLVKAWNLLRPSIRLDISPERLVDVANLYRLRTHLSEFFARKNNVSESHNDALYWMSWAYRLKLITFGNERNFDWNLEEISQFNVELVQILIEAGKYELAEYIMENTKEFIKLATTNLEVEPKNVLEIQGNFKFLENILNILLRRSSII